MSKMKRLASLTPRNKRYMAIIDEHLYVEVHPSGKKTWFLRKMVDGKQIKKSLGSVDEVNFYEARQMRDQFLLALDRCKKDGEEDVPQSPSFADIAEEWMDVKCIPQTEERNIRKQRSRLDHYVLPALGDLPCNEIKAPKVLQLLRRIEGEGHNSLAHDVAILISMIMRFGEACGYDCHDVVPALKGALAPVKVTHYASIHDPAEIRVLLQKINDLPACSTKFGLLLCAYTFCRPSEVREARWEEIDFDKAEWHIPAARMKMRKPHIVPLSRQVLEILSFAKYSARNSPYVLPSSRDLEKCICPDAYKSMLRHMGYQKDMMTAHGFRSMASTALNAHGWPGDAIERQLSHSDKDKVRASYNHWDYIDIRRKMMQWYADYLDGILNGQIV